jgi:hypothetical protein
VTIKKEIAIDTDAASFTGALLGIVGCTAFAAVGLWSLVNLRVGTFAASWRDYLAAIFALWALANVKERAARFAFAICLVMEGVRIGASLLHVPTDTTRLFFLCSTLTSVLLFGAMAAFLTGWLWKTLRNARIDGRSVGRIDTKRN